MSVRPSLSGTLGKNAFEVSPNGPGYLLTWNGNPGSAVRAASLAEAADLIERGPPAAAAAPGHGAAGVAEDGFRQAGYTDRAAAHPMPPRSLAAFAAFTGAKGPDALPAAWRYAPNAWCLETWEIIVSESLTLPDGEPDPAAALYRAARRGRPGSPDANTLKAYARAHAAIRQGKA